MTGYDPSTALIVVDVQNDFADPEGSLYVRGGDAVVPRVNSQIDAAIAAGGIVIYTQDWHPEHTPHFAKDGGIWPDHCVRDTRGAAFHPGLKVSGEVVRKGEDGADGYSAFSVRDPQSGDISATRLQSLLATAGVERVVICGLATDYCVVETALDARRLGFGTTVLTSAIAAVERAPGDAGRALDRMREAGVVIG